MGWAVLNKYIKYKTKKTCFVIDAHITILHINFKDFKLHALSLRGEVHRKMDSQY